MTVIPFGPRERMPTAAPPASETAEPQSHREMDVWPRPPVSIPTPPSPRPVLTLVR